MRAPACAALQVRPRHRQSRFPKVVCDYFLALLPALEGSHSQMVTRPPVHERTRVPGLATQITCRGDDGKCAGRFLETGRLTPASCLKASGFPESRPLRSLDSVSDPASAGLTRLRSQPPPPCGSIPANNAPENVVPLPLQKKICEEFLRATFRRSSLFGLLLSSARLRQHRLRSRFAVGNRQNSSAGR